MQGSQYKKAVIITCDYGTSHNAVCCLEHLAFSDNEFVERMNANRRIQNAFDLIASQNDSTPVSELDLDEADKVAFLFVEYALLNRARFACCQKGCFKTCYRLIKEDETYKQAMDQCLNMELNYVSQLLHRLDSDGAKHAKERLSYWLNVDVQNDEEEMDNEVLNGEEQLDNESVEEQNETVHPVSDCEEFSYESDNL